MPPPPAPLTDHARLLDLARRRPPAPPAPREIAPGVVLRPAQAAALNELAAAPAPRGAVVALPVGGGKTLVGLLAAAVVSPPVARPLALVPAPLARQWEAHRAMWRGRGVPVPDGAVLSHDVLSSPTGARSLDELAPDLIVIDEAHAFRRLESARTKRLLRYVIARPETRIVIMTGSLVADSLRDSAHLLELALREGAPIPLGEVTLRSWCAVVDHRGDPAPIDWGAIWPMVRETTTPDPGPLVWDPPSARMPHHRRLTLARAMVGRLLQRAPGVVIAAPGPDDVSASLAIRQIRAPVPRSVRDAIVQLEGRWALPDGSELVDALEIDRHRRTLSRGYFEAPRWPSATEGGAPTVPEDVEWLEARRAWAAAVRTHLAYHARPGADSEATVAATVAAGRAGGALTRAWARWDAVRGRWPQGPPRERVWLPGAREWLLAMVRAWLEECGDRDRPGARCAPRGLVWYSRTAVEEALAEILPVHGAGSSPPSGRVPAAALATRVHGIGTDGLQGSWCCALVVDVPSSAQTWEQLTGRLHRSGQTAPEVRYDVLTPTWVGRHALDEAIARTEVMAAGSGLGDGAKFRVCRWDPPHTLNISGAFLDAG